MNTIEIYGIKNCNSMKKAFDFLQRYNITYVFIDFKKEKLSIDILKDIVSHVGMDSLVNKKGTTYKKLVSQGIDITLDSILDNTSIIKRPLVVIRRGNNISRAFVGLDNMESLL